MKKQTPAKDVNVNAFEILQTLTRKPAEGPTKKKNPDKPAPVQLSSWKIGRVEGREGWGYKSYG